MPESCQPRTSTLPKCSAIFDGLAKPSGTAYVNVVSQRCFRVAETGPQSIVRSKRFDGTEPFSLAKPVPLLPVAFERFFAQAHEDWKASPRVKRFWTSTIIPWYLAAKIASRL